MGCPGGSLVKNLSASVQDMGFPEGLVLKNLPVKKESGV